MYIKSFRTSYNKVFLFTKLLYLILYNNDIIIKRHFSIRVWQMYVSIKFLQKRHYVEWTRVPRYKKNREGYSSEEAKF